MESPASRSAELDALFAPFPPVRGGARLAATLGPRGSWGCGRLGMCLRRPLREEFRRGRRCRRRRRARRTRPDWRRHRYQVVLADAGGALPQRAGSGGAITDALVRRLGDRGRIECGVQVTVVVRGGRAAASAPPTAASSRPARSSARSTRRSSSAASSAASASRDGAPGPRPLPVGQLDGQARLRAFGPDPAAWAAPGTERAGTIHVVDSVDALTEATAQLSRGLVPRGRSWSLASTRAPDPTRAPAGAEVFWAYTPRPARRAWRRGEDGLTGAWDEREAEIVAKRMTEEVERLAPAPCAACATAASQPAQDLQDQDRSARPRVDQRRHAGLCQQLFLRPVPGLGLPRPR